VTGTADSQRSFQFLERNLTICFSALLLLLLALQGGSWYAVSKASSEQHEHAFNNLVAHQRVQAQKFANEIAQVLIARAASDEVRAAEWQETAIRTANQCDAMLTAIIDGGEVAYPGHHGVRVAQLRVEGVRQQMEQARREWNELLQFANEAVRAGGRPERRDHYMRDVHAHAERAESAMAQATLRMQANGEANLERVKTFMNAAFGLGALLFAAIVAFVGIKIVGPLKQSRRALESEIAERKRLESELVATNRDLLDVNEVHEALFGCQSAQEVANVLCSALVRDFSAFFARVWLIRPADLCSECALASSCPSKTECLHLLSSSGFYTHIDGDHRRVPLGAFKIGLIAKGQGKTICNDVVNDERVHDRDWAARLGLRSFAGFPLSRDGRVLGVMAMFSKNELPEHLLQTLELLSELGVSALSSVEKAEALAEVNLELQTVSRRAGMAEVANSVLHNVGNVLNSVNVSASLVAEGLRKSKVGNVGRVAELICQHSDDLATFIADDPKGSQLPSYLSLLADHLLDEQARTIEELARLNDSVDHIKAIVSMQQSCAGMSGLVEQVNVGKLLDDVLTMNLTPADRREFQVERHFESIPTVRVEKHKLLQILVNLVRNAKDALQAGGKAEKCITVRLARSGADHLRIEVADNGVGIVPENLTRIFASGFTTKRGGHGFGLHSSALAAKEIGGCLTAHSDGEGMGATFTLEFPVETHSAAGAVA
jgi:signal transduction histidine kinase